MDTAADSFEQIIRYKTTKDLVPWLLALDKKDIVTVRAKAKSLHKELDEYKTSAAGVWARLMQPQQEMMLFLAGLATYSRKEALGRGFDMPWEFRRNHNEQRTEHRQWMLAVLEHARPSWLADWFERATRATPWQAPEYLLLRELEKREVLPFQPWLFGQALAHWPVLQSWQINGKTGVKPRVVIQSLLVQLQTDEQLLQRDVPLLFDFDTTVDSSAIYGQQEADSTDWQRLLLQLTESGHLDRSKLLTWCLMALRRDFRRPLLTWFKSVFMRLSPMPAERLACQSELVELLAHPLPLVVNFALDQLKDLWTAPGFAVEALLLYSDGLMSRQDLRTGVKNLLSGFGKLLKANPAQAPALASLYTAALAHADAAVQERAAKGLADILKAKKPLLSPVQADETAANLGLYADLLAPAARALLTPWLPETAVANSSAESAEDYEPRESFVPEISPNTAIAPVQDWHEWLFLTGQVLRNEGALALERWLEGFVRLRPHFPPTYADALQPYVVLIMPYLKGKTDAEQAAILQSSSGSGGHYGLVQALVLACANGFSSPRVPRVDVRGTYTVSDPLVAVEKQRFAFVETQLRAQCALPLLSTPTHAPGWIAPTVLVSRLLAYEAAEQEPNVADLVVALARTACLHRAEATAAQVLLTQLRHEGLRELLHWLLSPTGQPPPLVAPARKSLLKQFTERLERLLPAAAAPSTLAEALPWLWAVAARTKQPMADFPALAHLSVHECPGVVHAWQPRWELQRKSSTYVEKWKPGKPTVTDRWTELQIMPEEPKKPAPNDLLLYSLHATIKPAMLQNRWHYLSALAADFPFMAALLPNNLAPLYWHTLRLTATRDTVDSTTREVLAAALSSMLAAGPAFDEPATLLLAVALTHNAAVCRALALEVLLAAVAQRRLVPAALGQMLGQLLATEYVPVQRLAEGLAQARAIDPATDDALRQILEALLPQLPTEPLRNLRKLLEAYADVMARTRQPVPVVVRARLHEWSASASLRKASSTLLTSSVLA